MNEAVLPGTVASLAPHCQEQPRGPHTAGGSHCDSCRSDAPMLPRRRGSRPQDQHCEAWHPLFLWMPGDLDRFHWKKWAQTVTAPHCQERPGCTTHVLATTLGIGGSCSPLGLTPCKALPNVGCVRFVFIRGGGRLPQRLAPSPQCVHHFCIGAEGGSRPFLRPTKWSCCPRPVTSARGAGER